MYKPEKDTRFKVCIHFTKGDFQLFINKNYKQGCQSKAFSCFENGLGIVSSLNKCGTSLLRQQ